MEEIDEPGLLRLVSDHDIHNLNWETEQQDDGADDQSELQTNIWTNEDHVGREVGKVSDVDAAISAKNTEGMEMKDEQGIVSSRITTSDQEVNYSEEYCEEGMKRDRRREEENEEQRNSERASRFMASLIPLFVDDIEVHGEEEKIILGAMISDDNLLSKRDRRRKRQRFDRY
jgi:hypothetical protein